MNSASSTPLTTITTKHLSSSSLLQQRLGYRLTLTSRLLLVPATLAVTSPQEVSRVLCDGIHSYFGSTCGAKSSLSPPGSWNSHFITESWRKKREAKRQLRSARKSAEVVHSLAYNFITLVGTHSKLKSANACSSKRDIKAAKVGATVTSRGVPVRFWTGGLAVRCPPLVRRLLPLSSLRCTTQSPTTMFGRSPAPTPPQVELYCSPFSQCEVARVIRRTKTHSASSPYDQFGYINHLQEVSISDSCSGPAIQYLLGPGTIPEEWKCADIKLLPKSFAADDTNNPANF